jgi:hypothetical protein
MTHELMLHQMTVKKLTLRLNLTPRDVEMLLLLHTSRSLSTPSIYRLTGTRKSEINKIVGPKLEAAGWVRRESVVHSQKPGLPTNRWSLITESIHPLEQLILDIRRETLMSLGLVFSADEVWSTPSPCSMEGL